MRLFLFYLSIVFYFCPVFSIEKSPQANKTEFHLKLGADEDSITEFVIRIPSQFSVSCNTSNEETFCREFIQTGEKFELWTEIITVIESIRYKPDIKEFIENSLLNYRNGSSKIEYEPIIQKEKNMPVTVYMVDTPAKLVIPGDPLGKLQKIDEKNEIIASKVVQGNFSLAIIQYSARYEINKISPEAKKALKEKLSAFLNTCSIEKVLSKKKDTKNH